MNRYCGTLFIGSRLISSFLLVIMLLAGSVATAQLNREQYRNLSDEARFRLTDQYLTQHWLDFYNPRQTVATANLTMMRQEATDARTACLLQFFMFRNQAFERTKHAETSAKALSQMRDVLRFAQANDLVVEEGTSWLLLSLVTREHNSPMDERTRRLLAYEGAVKGLRRLESVPVAELANYHGGTYYLDHHLMYIGIYLFRIEEYELALRMFALGHRATGSSFDPRNPHFKGYAHFNWNFLNDMGECYRHLQQYPQAVDAYRRACVFGRRHRSVIQQVISYGNIGATLTLEGQHEEAIPYLTYAARESVRLGDHESAFNAVSPLAGAYIACQRYEDAHPVLLRAIVLHDSLRQAQYMPPTDSTRLIPIYAGLATVYQQRGDLKQALTYSQRSGRLRDRQLRQNDTRRFQQLREKLENEEYLTKLERIETDRRTTVWQRNAWLLVLALALVGCLWYLGVVVNRRRDAEAQLRLFADSARQKTELADKLQADIDRRSLDVGSTPTDQSLLRMAILTPADWDTFCRLFERVYPHLLTRLRQRYPDLTPAETRLICLSRLNLSTREIAATLGVSTDAVFKTRYRIRRKLNLPEAADLETLFATV